MNAFERQSSATPLLALALAAAVAAGLLLFDARRAEAANDELTGMLDTIAKARTGEAPDDLKEALAKVVALHNGSTEAPVRTRIQAGLGGLLKAKKAGSARSAAAEALGELNDPAGAYKVLKSALPAAKSSEVSPFELRAIEAVGKLTPQAAVPDLAKLMKKGRAAPAVTAVVRALSCYGNAGAVRVKVLEEMLGAGAAWKAKADAAQKKIDKKAAKKKPSKKGEDKPLKIDPKSKAAIAAWASYAPVLNESLNKLTGKSRASAADWLAVLKDKKTKLADLFTAS